MSWLLIVSRFANSIQVLVIWNFSKLIYDTIYQEQGQWFSLGKANFFPLNFWLPHAVHKICWYSKQQDLETWKFYPHSQLRYLANMRSASGESTLGSPEMSPLLGTFPGILTLEFEDYLNRLSAFASFAP